MVMLPELNYKPNLNQASFLIEFILDFASFTNFDNLKQGHFLARQYAQTCLTNVYVSHYLKQIFHFENWYNSKIFHYILFLICQLIIRKSYTIENGRSLGSCKGNNIRNEKKIIQNSQARQDMYKIIANERRKVKLYLPISRSCHG